MRVHVVVPEHKSDWIIARLARHLIERNGWTASRTPDKSAAVNVFIPYCQWRHTRWDKTLTAAWFTHKEDASVEHGAKLKRWEFTAPAVDLRVTPAALYVPELSKHGMTVHIPHPVELDKFKLKGRARNSRPTIGVSGIVYPGGRKGEGLVILLNRQCPEWKIKAAGRGWPIGARWYQWKQLQEFYHGLDVFLCTSLVEGGPVTMLEALSCGRPIVVPEGVGAVDDLPKGPGIYRYEPGSYDSMEAALQLAIIESPEPGIMRNYVRKMTPKRYAREWQAAIQRLVEANA